MAEMFGKVDGLQPRPRRLDAPVRRRAPASTAATRIVGGGLPLAVGLALADAMQGRDRVTACFFGEGAMAEGEFHESMNLAALWRLPVLFFCENNLYAMGTALARSESETDLAAQGRRLRGAGVDASTAWTSSPCEDAAAAGGGAGARGGGPVFLELRTYRFRAHSMYDPDRYRDKAEVERWRQRDPMLLLGERLRAEGALTDDDVAAMEQRGRRRDRRGGRVRRRRRRRAGRGPDPLRAHRERRMTAGAVVTTYREAMREAMREALQRDDRVFLMGEDVGAYGGCFAVSLGLLEEFGPERIRDTPLSESAFVGAGIGAALGGMRPIVEIMTVNFSLLALDQIVNNAATLLHMSGGQFSVPLVIRMTTGAGRQLAAQHSHSLEGWYAHIPGLRVARAGHARGRPRHALAGAGGPRPGDHLRARLALQRERRGRT